MHSWALLASHLEVDHCTCSSKTTISLLKDKVYLKRCMAGWSRKQSDGTFGQNPFTPLIVSQLSSRATPKAALVRLPGYRNREACEAKRQSTQSRPLEDSSLHRIEHLLCRQVSSDMLLYGPCLQCYVLVASAHPSGEHRRATRALS